MSDRDLRIVRELLTLRSRLREVMETALLPGPAPVAAAPGRYECAVDVWESDSEVVVEAELPGALGEDIELRIEDDMLVLGGELPAFPGGRGHSLRIERYCGRFHRAIALPAKVHGEPTATLRAGVLEVRLPKAREARRRVAIAGEGA